MKEFNLSEDIEDVLNKQFPKGECKERGNALVLFAMVNLKFKEFIRLLEEKVIVGNPHLRQMLIKLHKLCGDKLI